ncbi:FtsX-like permease family protein [Streptomyces caelestis]|uniref:FtsX-like permease family protein n=1 Tax=Streptomyces caelestis TaxID=36816 RepID=UPI0036579AD5
MLVAFFVVVDALGFALRRRHRELALLRTIAATPRQARRPVRGQVVVTTLLVTVPGWGVGAATARGLLAELQRRGMAAPGVRVPGTPIPTLVAPAVGLAAPAVATRRISRIAPAAALTASPTEHGRTGGQAHCVCSPRPACWSAAACCCGRSRHVRPGPDGPGRQRLPDVETVDVVAVGAGEGG